MALLPLALCRQLQRMTDILFDLSSKPKNIRSAISVLGAICILFFIQLLYRLLNDFASINDSCDTQLFIKEYVLRQVCNVQYSYLENRDNFRKRIAFADTNATAQMAVSIQGMFKVLYQGITFVSIGIALWELHPVFVVIIIATSFPAAVLAYFQSDETFRYRIKWSEDGAMVLHLFSLCASTNHGIQEVRHYELFDYLKARWRTIADGYIFKKNRLIARHLRFNLAADFLRSFVYLVILLLTAYLIYQTPSLGSGVFTLAYTLSDRLQRSTGIISTEIMKIAANFVCMREFFSLEELERDEVEENKSVPANSEKNQDIVFEHVYFTYPEGDREVLHDISLTIRAGEKVAIVGDNGSGKSTFISLLTGMFSPDQGRVLISNLDMEKYKRKLRENISVIFQDFAHYEGTLRENVTVSDSERNLSDDQIMELARRINVEEIITEQAEGLDSILGHMSRKGNDLSGGQWQKLALLRAVYRNKANIMILDEPTASLDPISEAQLYRDFARITEDKTTLLISHRLGITSLVDRILVFHEGRIIEDGSHQELMSMKGHYYTMYQAQAKWYQ